MTSIDGMTIPESFDGSSRKPKKINVAKKHRERQRLLLYISQGQKTMPQEGGFGTKLNISIDTPC